VADVVMLANRVFLPLIRILRDSACLQVLDLLAQRYAHDVGPLAAEPKEWVQPLESWLWELAATRPEANDPVALKIRNQVRMLSVPPPCRIGSSKKFAAHNRSFYFYYFYY
jgi:hypothetical protein